MNIKEKTIKKDTEKKIENTFLEIIKGSFISVVITIILLLIFSILLVYTDINENLAKPITIIITVFSILLGSIISTKNMSKNGMLRGSLVGFIYILVLYIISSIFVTGFAFSPTSIIIFVGAILAGLLGGIIGVNT